MKRDWLLYFTSAAYRYEYDLTSRRELQHHVDMLDKAAQRETVEVSAKKHREMYDDADRLQSNLVQFRKDFYQEMLDWEEMHKRHELRRQRGKGR